MRNVARWLAPVALLLAVAATVGVLTSGGAGGGDGALASRDVVGRGGHHGRRDPASHHRARARARARALHRRLRLPAHPVARTLRVPILMYHRVHAYATELTKSLPELTVEPARFAAEVRALAAAGYRTVTVAQLYRALFHGGRLPRRPVLLTFDDGYVDDVAQVLPVLRAHRMTAAFFIITGRFHEPGFLDRAQVRRLDAAGMDVGAHTRDHVDLPGLPAAMLDREVAGSRRDLQRLLHHPIAAFAYPAGRYDAATVAAVRRAGFALAVTTEPGSELSSQRSLLLPRVRVNGSTTPVALLACVEGRLACG